MYFNTPYISNHKNLDNKGIKRCKTNLKKMKTILYALLEYRQDSFSVKICRAKLCKRVRLVRHGISRRTKVHNDPKINLINTKYIPLHSKKNEKTSYIFLFTLAL